MATPGTPSTELGHEAPVAESRAKRDWWNFAMFSIGGVAALGLVVVLFGAYLLQSENTGVIVAGTIILMLAVIAWIFAALVMIGNLIWKIIASRGNKPRKSRPR